MAGRSVGLIIGLVGGLVGGLDLGLGFGLDLGLDYSGLTILQHYTLRFVLHRTGAMPWHYVHFLEEAHERILLQPAVGGGGYRFIHPLLQEYFASLGTGTPAHT